MKEFVEPELEIVELEKDDIISTSGCATDCPTKCSGYCYLVCSKQGTPTQN